MNNNEDKILEKLDHIEGQINPIYQSAQTMKELKEDLTPLANQAVRLMIEELEDVESSVQLEDLLYLLKRILRSVRNITYTLNQLENIIDLVQTVEPLLKSSVPQMINYLDDLEQRGILRIIQSTLDIRAKVAAAYTAEDIDQIGDGFVALLGVAQKLSSPQAAEFLNKFAEMPANIDLSQSKPIGPMGVISASFNKDFRKGLGVMMELMKAMGKMKDDD